MLSVETPEVQAFRDSARDMLSRRDHGQRVRAMARTAPTADREFWRQIAEAGWLAITVAEEDNGLGLGLDEACAIAEEVGRQAIPDPFVAVAVQAAGALSRAEPSLLRARLLSELCAGSALIGLAWQEQAGQLDPSPAARARVAGGALEITARYHAVTPVADCDGWLILTRNEIEPCLLWIPASSAGCGVQAARRIDGSNLGTLELAQCRVPADHILARGEAAIEAVRASLDAARIAYAAELVGVATQSLESTLDYLNTRVQFGKPIGSFQALQHRLVDAYIQIQLARFGLKQALATLHRDRSALPWLASAVKARASRAATDMTQLAVQLHGAIGYTDESAIGLGFKRALSLAQVAGSSRQHAARHFSLRRGTDSDSQADHPAHAWEQFPRDADWEAMPEAEFRGMLRAFFARHYPGHLRHMATRVHWDQIKSWYFTLSKQGWIAPAWPKAYGGMALPADKLIAFIEEQERYGVARPPDQGLVMLGPILIRYGTQAQRDAYLPGILSGEHVWCQGYSEPNAGSDLASLRCEAIIDGDDFIVNGQKTWSTLAQDATHMFMLVRTDNTGKKQHGISFLMVDLATPGVTVRPIRTIAGDEEFCEIFFDDVRVPRSNLVGELHQGWSLAKALLGFERLFSGSPKHSQYTLGLVSQLAQRLELFEDAAFVAEYAQLQLDLADLSAAYATFADMVKRGEALPPSISLLKIWATETHERTAQLLIETAREAGAAAGPADLAAGLRIDAMAPLFNASAAKIFSGTNEIQRNILAKVVLNLPS